MKDTKDRLFAARSVGALADTPIDGGGIARVEVMRARAPATPEHTATIETWSPVLADGRAARRPSIVLAHAPTFEAVETPAEPRAQFESDGHVVRAQIALATPASFYGTGAVCGPLLRNGRRTWLWNTDAWAYGEESPSLYQSHPYVLAVHPDGRATGIVADTARKGLVATAVDGVELAFEGEPYDVHLIDGDSPQAVQRALAASIGTIELPPRWALGYHQCRWSYASAAEVRELAANMTRHGIPCAAIWFDIDYMDRFRVFTWDDARFPDPAGLAAELAEQGIRAVAIVDPGVAVAADYDVHAEGLAGEHFVRDARGGLAAGRVWPGVCHFPDFTREETRDWWARRVEAFTREAGLAGIWCDMNEPACMRSPTGTLPEDARHGGSGGPGDSGDPVGGSHAEVHNLYGQLMAQATREGVRRARPDERPFVLTRSNHLSGARFAATWTGDNQGRWEDLAWSIPMVLNLGLSGQPFSGPDIGGFCGDVDEELFVRWFELGAYLPFCRGHAEKTSGRKEPWSLGERALAFVRAALERRVRLMPYLYTLFEESARTGLPVARPLFFADPADPALRATDDAFLLGADLLVAPIVDAGRDSRRLCLPRGEWYAFPAGGERLASEVLLPAPLGTTPVLARAGAVVVENFGTQGTRRTWHVFLDADGTAHGSLYEDDGDGYAFEDGGFARHAIAVRCRAGVIDVDVATAGNRRAADLPRRIVVHGVGPEPVVHEDLGGGSVDFPAMTP